MVTALFLVAFVLIVADDIAGMRLWPPVFRLGIPLWRETRTVPRPIAGTPERFDTASGRFRLIAPDVCLFRRKVFFGRFEFGSVFPIRCTCTWGGADAAIIGRAPLSSAVFLLLWVVFIAFSSGEMLTLLVIAVFLTAHLTASVWVEIRRGRQLLDEYVRAFSGPATEAAGEVVLTGAST